MEAIRLSRLNEFIRRTIALNFAQPIWIIAELVQAKLNKGHLYLELAERTEEDEVIAQSSAVIWKTNLAKISSEKFTSIFKEGNELKLKVQVDYHARFGLKLNILEVDSEFTLGQIARNRQLIIAKLIQEGLWQLNKSSQLPIAIKKIAVVTSITAAGKEDFEKHIVDNDYAYTFQLHYYPSAMQGQNTVNEICKALDRISRDSKNSYDCVVIIRGGGSKLDLIEFDQYEISKSISQMKIPVITGIGHHQDESIADMNSYLNLKTPTAVADYIIQYNCNFESKIIQLNEQILHLISKINNAKKDELNQLHILLRSRIQNIVSVRNFSLIHLKSKVKNSLHQSIHTKNLELQTLKYIIESNNPISILEKGFSMNYQNKKRIKRKEDVHPNKVLQTIFADGFINSKIEA